MGSDIRDPDILKPINKYYDKVFDHGYEYAKQEKSSYKTIVQEKFASVGALPIVNPEMGLFLKKNVFPKSHQVYLRINIENFSPIYPNKESKNKITIVHSPSVLIAKGSSIILPLIERLQKIYDFTFIMLHQKPRSEVLEIIQKADIFIDQIIGGSYGMAAMESMAYGKPTLCYIMPEVFKNGLSSECPIVNVNPETIEQKLIELILNPQMRYDIGLASRAYVEKYHDAKVIAQQLLEIYKSEHY